MPTEWSLAVEDFGRIERADVTVKPLTVLVGPNNSGKSYLGTLIWGIEKGGLSDWPHEYEPLHRPIQQWVARAQQNEGSWMPRTIEEERAIRTGWPGYIREALAEFCRLLFDTENIRPGRLMASSPAFDTTWYAAAERMAQPDGLQPWIFQFSTRNDIPTMSRVDRDDPVVPPIILGHPREKLPDGGLVARLAKLSGSLSIGLHAEYLLIDPIFLPASRTGFSLFYPTFLQATLTGTLTQRRGSIERAGSSNGAPTSTSSRFTLPHVHLLSGLASAFGGERGPYADEAGRLERECLDGTIVVRAETGVARYAFRPDGVTEDIGLQLSSSLVTELMPLVVLLRYAKSLPFLVIEEPEAHLHPRLQRIVTRCLCRLVRRGVRVLITTHSATVAQQINNLVKLGDIDEARRSTLQRRYGYGETEYLLGDEVAVHEMRFLGNRRAVVDRLELGIGGFAMPTFNDDLVAFGEETLAFNAVLDPEGKE